MLLLLFCSCCRELQSYLWWRDGSILAAMALLIQALHNLGLMPTSPTRQLHFHIPASARLNLRGLFSWVYPLQTMSSKSPTELAMCLLTNLDLSELWNVVSYLPSDYGPDPAMTSSKFLCHQLDCNYIFFNEARIPAFRTAPLFQIFLSEVLFVLGYTSVFFIFFIIS